MKGNRSELISIGEILNRQYSFVIPSYQRGYRWTFFEVNDLLNDVWEFKSQDKPKGEFYCLQPIVVQKSNIENEFIVVDGQQRLTTISIIFSSLKRQLDALEADKFSIEYETREGSKEYLETMDEERSTENIDFMHMHQAYNTILNWFQDKSGPDKMNFLKTFLDGDEDNNVRFIWYELSNNENPIEVFTRLNMGKIQLTNAELIKAIFMSKGLLSETDKIDDFYYKTHEIANEWDKYETTLRDESFWGFLTDNSNYENHIELIFNLISENGKEDGSNDSKNKYATFRNFRKEIRSFEDAKTKWGEIKLTYQILHDWFKNDEFFHLVGFLIATGEPLKELLKKSKEKTKEGFLEHLRATISNKIPEDLESLNYQDDKKKLRSTLLLFNILTIINNPESNARFHFGKYKAQKWDIEHIHSVKSEIPISNKDRNEWLRNIQEFTDKEELKIRIETYIESPPKERESFEDVYDFIITKYSPDTLGVYKNDLSNLTLLDQHTNRSYKNSIFPIKRKTIIERDGIGVFIPICTRNVFLKYYTLNVDYSTLWGNDDMLNYKTAIVNTIKNYVNGNT